MLAVLSPAKSLNLDPVTPPRAATTPALLDEAERLVGAMRKKSTKKIQALMSISEKLAELNYERYQAFSTPFSEDNAKPAILTFAGDTYVGFDAATMDADDLAYAQGSVAILSGLYGVLRPMDLMQPYRLEMGTRLKTRRGANLYKYWGDRITKQLNAMTEGHEDRTIVNVASNEYFKSVNTAKLAGGHVTASFKEIKDGEARMIGLTAKRARGSLARYIVDHRLTRVEQLKAFNVGDYAYQADQSTDTEWVFTRPWRSMANPAA